MKLKLLVGLLTVLLLSLLVAWLWLRQSLPLLDGELNTGLLNAPATIHRDRQGIAFIESKDRNSIAFALGFLHAQERFFQMDLLRRNSAGELSELVGADALEHDRAVRLHQFRKRAQRNIAAMPSAQRQLLTRYTEGVNFGLSQLHAKPWEYTLLGQQPRPWRNADSLLTSFSMYLTLQSPIGKFELRDTALADLLPQDLYQFFFPQGGIWDAPLQGHARAPIAIPQTPISAILPPNGSGSLVYQKMESDDKIYGSNNWVVGGALTAHGGAIVANDMHLGLNVPNIWYRAGWTIPGTQRAIRGVTLPGSPIIVVGSNERIAWGFTNTAGDWGDLIQLEISDDGRQYKSPQGWRFFELEDESIAIKGSAAEIIQVRKTLWGPVVAENHRGIPLAYRWVAHDQRGANLNLLLLEQVESAKAALNLGSQLGIPHQNFVVGDHQGHIGWTVAGAIPRRVGLNGSRSRSWANGDARWEGYLTAREQPRIFNPPSQRIWSANGRTMDGASLKAMGNHGYALGARQQQIRDALFAQDHFSEQDLLNLQLDDRALFLQRWQKQLLTTLKGIQGYEPIVTQIENWGGRASAGSVGYRVVRNFRLKFLELSTAPVLTYMRQHQQAFSFGPTKRQLEYAAWEMLEQEPKHLLNPDFESWKLLKLAAVDAVLKAMSSDRRPLTEQTWGQQNRAQIQHPLGHALSAVDWFTAMPADQLPGDTHMPRFQSPTHGASQRMVIAPSRASTGIFHMATGQSAHPLSPFFSNGHQDWVAGNPSPFMEQQPRYQLTLH